MSRRFVLFVATAALLTAMAAPAIAGPAQRSKPCDEAPVVTEFPTVASVEVSVIDAITGQRIKGALVEINGKIIDAIARTDDRGKAVMFVLRKLLHMVTVKADGYAPARMKIRAKKSMPKSNRIELWLIPADPA